VDGLGAEGGALWEVAAEQEILLRSLDEPVGLFEGDIDLAGELGGVAAGLAEVGHKLLGGGEGALGGGEETREGVEGGIEAPQALLADDGQVAGRVDGRGELQGDPVHLGHQAPEIDGGGAGLGEGRFEVGGQLAVGHHPAGEAVAAREGLGEVVEVGEGRAHGADGFDHLGAEQGHVAGHAGHDLHH
jgi:hypothetical protein